MAASACDAGGQEFQAVDSPDVAVVDVLATTELEGGAAGAAPVPRQTALNRSGSTSGVVPTTRLTVVFNRFLDPVDAALRQSFCLQNPGKPVTTPDECVDGRVFLSPAYDPVHRQVTLYLDDALAADTVYALTIMAPPADGEAIPYGIRAFDGAPLRTSVVVQFKTGPAAGDLEAPPKGDRFCRANSCFAGTDSRTGCQATCKPGDAACLADCCPEGVFTYLKNCSYTTCHSEGADPFEPGTLGPAMGLNMSTQDLLRLTAFDKTAHGSQTGEHAADPDLSGTKFGRAMPIIDPGNPGNSYLLYKVMAHPNYLQGPASPGVDEHFRMRKGVVVGMPMPATVTWLSPRPDVGLEAISAWISEGAPMSTCCNGAKEPDETDVDCGGACGPTCAVKQVCTTTADCDADLACVEKDGVLQCTPTM